MTFRSNKRVAIAAWSVYAVTLAVAALATVIAIADRNIPAEEGQPPMIVQLPFFAPILIGYSTVGALVASRRPANLIGWLCSLLAFVVAGWMLLAAYRHHTANAALYWLTIDVADLEPAIFGLILLLFPTGRLPSKAWRAVAIALLVAPLLAWIARFSWPANLVLVGGFLLAASAPIVRLRRARSVERRQIEWFVYAVALMVGIFLLGGVLGLVGYVDVAGLLWGVGVFCIGLTAVAIGIAILRYRLYDIDVLINRTLVYGALSAILAATYFALIVAFHAVLQPLFPGSDVSVALATLAVVALFNPLRSRIQRAVDRRFYRAKYDAEHTLDAFAARLRDEVDLDAVRHDLLDAVNRTVTPTTASLWLRR